MEKPTRLSDSDFPLEPAPEELPPNPARVITPTTEAATAAFHLMLMLVTRSCSGRRLRGGGASKSPTLLVFSALLPPFRDLDVGVSRLTRVQPPACGLTLVWTASGRSMDGGGAPRDGAG